MAKVWTTRGTVATTLTVADPDMRNYPHVYVAFAYHDAATFDSPVTPGAGTIAVSGTVNGAGGYVSFPDSPVDCTDVGDSANAGAPFASIQAVPAGITTATHYIMTITANES